MKGDPFGFKKTKAVTSQASLDELSAILGRPATVDDLSRHHGRKVELTPDDMLKDTDRSGPVIFHMEQLSKVNLVNKQAILDYARLTTCDACNAVCIWSVSTLEMHKKAVNKHKLCTVCCAMLEAIQRSSDKERAKWQ